MENESRFMWLFVFFDLPTKTKDQRKAASQFRHHLLKDGFIMIQYSIYARICNGQDRLEKHLLRLEFHLPKKGAIRAMQITDQQYSRIKILLGNETENEKQKAEQLLLF
jgi:CRISPR-associated protein Cas2